MHKGKTRAIARVWFDSPHLHTSQTPGFRWKPGVCLRFGRSALA